MGTRVFVGSPGGKRDANIRSGGHLPLPKWEPHEVQKETYLGITFRVLSGYTGVCEKPHIPSAFGRGMRIAHPWGYLIALLTVSMRRQESVPT